MGEGQIAVIGAGGAGLSAARYLTSQGFGVSIFDSLDELGAQRDWRAGLGLGSAPDGVGAHLRPEAAVGVSNTAHFDRAVVATGRFNRPSIPASAGLTGFRGVGGVSHTFRYEGPERYRGQRIVVGGGSISALEIAGFVGFVGFARA